MTTNSGIWLPVIALLVPAVTAQTATDQTPEPSAPVAKAAEKSALSFYGDLRLRWESSFKVPGMADRHRQRLRARIGMKYDFSDEIELGLRARTGNPADPKSPYVDFGNLFQSFEFNLDKAYATYKPKEVKGLVLSAGKIGHPMKRNPIYGEHLWDGDVNPEGGTVGFGRKVENSFLTTYKVTGAVWAIEENSNNSESIGAFIEGAVGLKAGESGKVNASVAFHNIDNTSPAGANGSLFAANRGNAANVTNDGYASDFGILNPIVAYTHTGASIPITVAGEFLINMRAADNVGDKGWALGVSAGGKKTGSHRCYYQYQSIEQDAIFTPFSQDDFLIATNHNSHVLGWHYLPIDNLDIHLWGMASEPETPASGANTATRYRARVDFTFKF